MKVWKYCIKRKSITCYMYVLTWMQYIQLPTINFGNSDWIQAILHVQYMWRPSSKPTKSCTWQFSVIDQNTWLGWRTQFLCLRPPKVVAGGIMFSGRPSVRTYVRPSRFRSRDNFRTVWWTTLLLGSCMHMGGTMNWLDFGGERSKVKGHRA